jgi:GTPase
VLEADLILHVRDISHPESAEQAADVADILGKLGVNAATPMIEVWNKIDAVDPALQGTLTDQAARLDHVVAVSALTGQGIRPLLDRVTRLLDEERQEAEVMVPFADGRRRAWLHAEGVVVAEVEGEDGHRVAVRWTARQATAFAQVRG